ncbi:GNAT family N-acetyltransferase [Clostridium uliginosum]|uniref:Acetyltransferase (GNAT) family protein n=1 Tax=Clostridium uliginosum TaxID=119641 RepID=A0A1I1PL85_9CLOT|nr:GNAT family N-acetyltransferase [Clostridium uliginosum]SFD10427.1 Acetyltransferase (GNAT) family protein [Clostridium uliginosum]
MGILGVHEEDLQECAKLFAEVFNGEPWNDKWTTESAYKRLKYIYMCPDFVGVKYIENGKIKGAIFGNCEEWYEGRHFNIKEVFVSSEMQGNHVGSKLLESIQSEVKKLGVDFLLLFTQNNSIKNFYLKDNFEEAKSLCIMTKNI